MNLKIGGNSVGKIMYGGQEFGGATKLEPGTILYVVDPGTESFENAHLFNTTKNWSNIDGINIAEVRGVFSDSTYEVDISGDDFKNLDIEKEYKLGGQQMTISRSIVDGEYRLNVSGYYSIYTVVIRAI